MDLLGIGFYDTIMSHILCNVMSIILRADSYLGYKRAIDSYKKSNE